jgi:serine/threonine protein kinase
MATHLLSLLAFLDFDDIFLVLFELFTSAKKLTGWASKASDQRWQSYLSPNGPADYDLTVMVFERLGSNLEDLFRYCGNRCSLKTTLMIFDRLLRRVESFHSMQYLYLDVKPENFLMGVGERGNLIYMIDLGLAIYHRPDQTMYGSTSARNPQLISTCSINGYLGIGGQHSIFHTTQVYG